MATHDIVAAPDLAQLEAVVRERKRGGARLPSNFGPPPLCRAEWRPLARLTDIAAEWRSLSARALEPNVFYEPAFALAAAPVFGADAGAVLVWTGEPRRLAGFFPARVARHRHGLTGAVLTGWTHPYAPLGLPLVDRDLVEPAIAAWLDHVAQAPALPKVVLLPLLPHDGPFTATLAAILHRRGESIARFGAHARALLAPDSDHRLYLDHALGARKRKELRRQRRRLDDRGMVSHAAFEQGADLEQALTDFMVLEGEGWKGKAGTAAASVPATRDFLHAAVLGLAAEGKARIDRLAIGHDPIALTIMLRSNDTAWLWKIAYDEALARASPGVQLTLDVTQALLDDVTIARADSCAAADHPMIDHIWRERLALADCLIAVGPDAPLRFAKACRRETLRRVAIDMAKSARDRLRALLRRA